MQKKLCWFQCVVISTVMFLGIHAYAGGVAYSVSGTVRDKEDLLNGLPGVVVSVDGKSATTDAKGDYTVSGVFDGPQTVTATFANYTISPKSINVTGFMKGVDLVAIGDKHELRDAKSIPAQKDTSMLCMDGCSKAGKEAYNKPHTCVPTACPHDKQHCWAAAIRMACANYKGTLTQDEICQYAFKGGAPEEDLAHGKTSNGNYMKTYDWALGTTSTFRLKEPSEAEFRAWLDAGHPIVMSIKNGLQSHAFVISGYRYKAAKFELKRLNELSNDGSTHWEPIGSYANGIPGWTFLDAMAPLLAVAPLNKDADVDVDSDKDGVMDYDEKQRWEGAYDLNEKNADTDNDGLPDGMDIEGYLYVGVGETYKGNNFDPDKDGKRCEVDDDSDDGGVLDGDEDVVKNGVVDTDETDPYAPAKTKAGEVTKDNDITKVKISIAPAKAEKFTMNDKSAAIDVVQVGAIKVTLNFLRADGTALPVGYVKNSPLVVTYTPKGGTATTITLTPSKAAPTDQWEGTMTIDKTTKNGRAEFAVKNGLTDVVITKDKLFWVDTSNTERDSLGGK